MGFAINTNLDALNAYQNLTNTQNAISKSLQQLSSGLRINNAGDDAAGMTISADIGAQISGLTKAQANAADGTSVVQTADGGLQQSQTLLGQLRDLAVQAANDSNSASARAAISTQATAIVNQISQIGQSTNFNGIYLLNGSAGTNGVLNFQVGANGNANSQIGVNLTSANLTTVSAALTTGTSYTATTYTAGTGTYAATAYNGAYTFTSTQANGTATTVSATLSGTNQTFAQVASSLNANAAFAASFTAGVNASNQLSITANNGGLASVDSASATRLAAAGTSGSAGAAATPGSASTGLDFSSASGAQAAITTIQNQIDAVTSARANIGALENRFSAVSSAISTSVQNLTAANSRITDVDFASAMVTFSKQNILAQTGTAMLSQANSLPQLALKLLQG